MLGGVGYAMLKHEAAGVGCYRLWAHRTDGSWTLQHTVTTWKSRIRRREESSAPTPFSGGHSWLIRFVNDVLGSGVHGLRLYVFLAAHNGVATLKSFAALSKGH